MNLKFTLLNRNWVGVFFRKRHWFGKNCRTSPSMDSLVSDNTASKAVSNTMASFRCSLSASIRCEDETNIYTFLSNAIKRVYVFLFFPGFLSRFNTSDNITRSVLGRKCWAAVGSKQQTTCVTFAKMISFSRIGWFVTVAVPFTH